MKYRININYETSQYDIRNQLTSDYDSLFHGDLNEETYNTFFLPTLGVYLNDVFIEEQKSDQIDGLDKIYLNEQLAIQLDKQLSRNLGEHAFKYLNKQLYKPLLEQMEEYLDEQLEVSLK